MLTTVGIKLLMSELWGEFVMDVFDGSGKRGVTYELLELVSPGIKRVVEKGEKTYIR